MYAALNENNQIIYANNLNADQKYSNSWKCPICFQEVYFKENFKGTKFFVHLTACHKDGSQIRNSPLESYNHHSAKKILIQAAIRKDIVIREEYPLPDINQIADVFIHDTTTNLKKVIEYQETPVRGQEILKRTQNYLSQVDECHWLINYDCTQKKRAFQQRWLQTMLHYQQGSGFYLQMLDLTTQEVVYLKSLPLIYPAHCLVYEEERVKPEIFIYRYLEGSNGTIKRRVLHKPKSVKNHQQQLLSMTANPSNRKELIHLYELGIHLEQLPAWLIQENWKILCAKSNPWVILIWTFLLFKEFNGPFTVKDAAIKLQNCPRIKLVKLPLISHNIYTLLAEWLLNLFSSKKLTIQLDSSVWTWRQ